MDEEHGEGDKSAADLFNEKPSWYDEPELSDAQLVPNFVPSRHDRLGDTAGMASLPTRTAANTGRQAELMWVVIILAVLGGGALLLMLSGVLGGGISGSSQEFAAGDCVSPVETVTSFGFAAGANECDSDFPAEVLGTFEPVGIDQMPNENDPFWRTAFERCADMMSADGIPLPMPSATTEQEWADGNHTIVCVWISAESLGEAFAEGFAALDN